MDATKIFAKRLRELREESGLSQTQLAENLNVSRGSISFYENGERTPDINFLCSVIDNFDVPVEYLLGYINTKKFENIDISLYLGLSDKAIYNLKEAHYDQEYLSFILEAENFEDLMFLICDYFSIFRKYGFDARHNTTRFDDYGSYLEYGISRMFIEILSQIRSNICCRQYLDIPEPEKMQREEKQKKITQIYENIREELCREKETIHKNIKEKENDCERAEMLLEEARRIKKRRQKH